jgi:hypothetical protein
MREFHTEPDIFAKLRKAFAQCARSFQILAHNTHILAQSAEILVSVLGAPEWDTARAQVHEAQERVDALVARERDMELQFGIAKND